MPHTVGEHLYISPYIAGSCVAHMISRCWPCAEEDPERQGGLRDQEHHPLRPRAHPKAGVRRPGRGYQREQREGQTRKCGVDLGLEPLWHLLSVAETPHIIVAIRGLGRSAPQGKWLSDTVV